jgi:hypothetical protein
MLKRWQLPAASGDDGDVGFCSSLVEPAINGRAGESRESVRLGERKGDRPGCHRG